MSLYHDFNVIVYYSIVNYFKNCGTIDTGISIYEKLLYIINNQMREYGTYLPA